MHHRRLAKKKDWLSCLTLGMPDFLVLKTAARHTVEARQSENDHPPTPKRRGERQRERERERERENERNSSRFQL